MTDENKNKEKMTFSGVIDWLTGTIGKVTALVIAVGALAIQVPKLFPGSSPTPTDEPAAACYRLEVLHPDKVPINQVKSGTMSWFDVFFENNCKDDLLVRVEFKHMGGGIVIPPSDNWPGYTIRPGEKIKKKVNPPSLDLLTDKPQVVQILVSIYRKDNQKLLREDTCQIEMVG